MTENTELLLAPVPKHLSHRPGEFDPSQRKYIRLQAEDTQSLVPAAKRTGLGWEITASPMAPKEQVGLIITLDDSADIPLDGYKLSVGLRGITITATSPSGAFYGACTLAQILRQCQGGIPCLSISDWPDFPARGVMLDISRDKVPTMDTLYHLVDLLAGWKINQVQLYTEHTFQYLAHPVVWEHASPMTGQEILELDAYCKSRFIELVPNQNSFGHMERWLKHDRYRPISEAPNGSNTDWGHMSQPFSLCPVDKRSIPFLKGLYDELLPHFTSAMFNVGLDETVDLGHGRSRKACEERGRGHVYLDFLLGIHKLVEGHGRKMMFWGDIIMHHPELIPKLPRDVIAMEWGYEFDHPFKDHGAMFGDSGIPFYVCPGTSSWLSIVGRAENAIGNIMTAARAGLKQGAIGVLNTDWGDWGHWQPLSVSYLGFMVGAIGSWNAKTDPRPTLAQNLSLHAFDDPTGRTGKTFYELGDIYLLFRRRTRNSSIPWQALFWPKKPEIWQDVKLEEFEAMSDKLDELSSSGCETVKSELEHVIGLLRLSADVGREKLGGWKIKGRESRFEEARRDHERVWLMRNRPGGLSDSTARLGDKAGG